MKINCIAEVQVRINKQGAEYKVLALFWENKKTGELVPFHELYIKDNLAQVLEYLIKTE